MERPQWLDETEMAAWMAFLETQNRLQRRIDAQLRADAGLTQAQYEILSRLADAPAGRLRMSELANQIVTSLSGLSYRVTQLCAAGLAAREPDPSDERAVLVSLTDAGHELLRAAAPGHVRVVREGLLAALTPAQVAALADLLGRTSAELRELDS